MSAAIPQLDGSVVARRMTKSGRLLHYRLMVIQQPERARACGAGPKASADRRPVDPPPLVELRIFEGPTLEQATDITFVYNANFILYAKLEHAPSPTHGPSAANNGPPVLTGIPVSGMNHLDRPSEAGYFLFADLSVRQEGCYRLDFHLYEETKEEKDLGIEGPDGPPARSSFDWRVSISSNDFNVYSAKKFPGLTESTELSRVIAEQGCRVRIRRDVRMRRRRTKGSSSKEQDEGTTADEESTHPMARERDTSEQPREPCTHPYAASNHSTASADRAAPYVPAAPTTPKHPIVAPPPPPPPPTPPSAYATALPPRATLPPLPSPSALPPPPSLPPLPSSRVPPGPAPALPHLQALISADRLGLARHFSPKQLFDSSKSPSAPRPSWRARPSTVSFLLRSPPDASSPSPPRARTHPESLSSSIYRAPDASSTVPLSPHDTRPKDDLYRTRSSPAAATSSPYTSALPSPVMDRTPKPMSYSPPTLPSIKSPFLPHSPSHTAARPPSRTLHNPAISAKAVATKRQRDDEPSGHLALAPGVGEPKPELDAADPKALPGRYMCTNGRCINILN